MGGGGFHIPTWEQAMRAVKSDQNVRNLGKLASQYGPGATSAERPLRLVQSTNHSVAPKILPELAVERYRRGYHHRRSPRTAVTLLHQCREHTC